MKTLNEMIEEVSKGTKRIDGQVTLDKAYDVKCHWAGTIIRIDLKPINKGSQ